MKSKVVAGVLAFFVGVFGIHRFYLGQVGKGIAYVIFCWFPLIWLIAFIDAIMLLTMDDRVFDAKYNSTQNSYGYANENRRGYQDSRRPSFDNERPAYNRYETEAQERYRRREEERERLKQMPQESKKYTSNRPNPFKEEGSKLYKDYDFKGAIKSYQQALRVEPNDPAIHFDLACLYSLMEDLSHSYLHLSKAVENGFVQYDEVRNNDHLAFLRTDAAFEAFVANGYRNAAYASPNPIQQLPPRQKDEINLMSDEMMQKLERLGVLRDKGILTDVEFQKQKNQILRG